MTTAPLPHLPLFPAFAGSSNPALLAALASLPDYDQHETASETLGEAKIKASTDLLTATRARLTLVEQVAATARAGKPISEALTRRAAQVVTGLAEAAALVTILQEADQQLATGRDQILSAAPAALMRHLDGQLQAALAEARGLGLGAVSDAQHAIDAGMVEAWQRYLSLTGIHAVIRSAQQLVTAHLAGNNGLMAQHLHTFGAVRNYADVFPQWYDHQRRVALGTVNGEPIYATPPWSETDPAGLWRYAVQHFHVELWVPTAAELQAAYTEAVTEARQLDTARDRQDQGANLTPDERDQLTRHHLLEQQHLNPQGALR